MILRDNPVLTRELMVNLRAPRAFVFQLLYVGFLSLLLIQAWPNNQSNTLTLGSGAAQRLFGLFFLGQFVLVALMAPTFAAGSFTGEKERKTYELLLVSPLRPSTILIGKLLSSMTYLVLLVTSSLPLMILCFLLGGILLSEVVRAYLVLLLAAGTFGLLSLACSSVFRRTSSALVVSYLVILPVALGFMSLAGVDRAPFREFLTVALLPPWCLLIWCGVFYVMNNRLLHGSDNGGEAREAADEVEEQRYAIGVVIDRNMWPDKLFAPAKRADLMPDGVNPVLDKELRSEIFSQGTLMLRVVIQMSMILSMPLMVYWLFVAPELAGYYVSYVVVFNMLVGPVFSAGSITQERERKTISLLLTTLLTPKTILVAKLLAALRVSTVLTFLLTEQIFLAYIFIGDLHPWNRIWTLPIFLLIIAVTCLFTSSLGLLCSALARKTSVSMVMTYLLLLLAFVGPLGFKNYQLAFSDISEKSLDIWTVSSPFAAAWDVPMGQREGLGYANEPAKRPGANLPGLGIPIWLAYLILCPLVCPLLWALTYFVFRYKWWKAGHAV